MSKPYVPKPPLLRFKNRNLHAPGALRDFFLVICASSLALNSTLDQRVVEQALEEIRPLRRENGFPSSGTTRLDQRRRITRWFAGVVTVKSTTIIAVVADKPRRHPMEMTRRHMFGAACAAAAMTLTRSALGGWEPSERYPDPAIKS